MTDSIELTKEEEKAIASLKRLAKRWPETLHVFCSGTMFVRKGGNGARFDVDVIHGIPNDGGDGGDAID